MNGLRASPSGRVQDPFAKQVTLRSGRRTDVDRLVGCAHMRRCGIGVAVDRHAGDAELATGANDAKGDFASVGDEELGEQWIRKLR